MPQPLEVPGQLIFSAGEVRVARAALFIALHHRDSVAADDGVVQTLTGVEVADIIRLMDEIDELTGHNRDVRQIIEQRLEYLSSLSDAELALHRDHAREMAREAVRRNVNVAAELQIRIDATASG